MKAEITPENKAKFFAQYWGQKIAHYSDGNNARYTVCVGKYPFSSIHHIILKPLSSISDEDAIDVAKIVHSTSFLNHKHKWEVDVDVEYGFKTVSAKGSYHSFDIDIIDDGHVSMYDGDNPTLSTLNHYGALDLLRSRGYALPYMGLPVKEMIEAGWIKLID